MVYSIADNKDPPSIAILNGLVEGLLIANGIAAAHTDDSQLKDPI